MTDVQLRKLYREPGIWKDKLTRWDEDRKRMGRVTGYQLRIARGYREKYAESQAQLAAALRNDAYRAKLIMIHMMES